MSICFELRQATDDQIATLLADPPLIHAFLDDEDEEPERTAPRFQRFPGDEIDLDKAWNGIHYLQTGAALEGDPPLNFILFGGVEIGFEDVGYGAARALRVRKLPSLPMRWRESPRTRCGRATIPSP